jgi:hypothetical protein
MLSHAIFQKGKGKKKKNEVARLASLKTMKTPRVRAEQGASF